MRYDRSQSASDADRSRPDPGDQGNVGEAQSLLGQALDRLTQLGKDGADLLGGAVLASLRSAHAMLGTAWDAAAPGVGEAVSDIRRKGVEEAWFGREVTRPELDVTHHGPSSEVEPARLGFQDLMQLQAAMLPPVDPDAPGQDGAPSQSPDL